MVVFVCLSWGKGILVGLVLWYVRRGFSFLVGYDSGEGGDQGPCSGIDGHDILFK
jgi:hypothetical protein